MATRDQHGSQPKRRKYTAWPNRPGMMNFNLFDGLSETPYQNSKKRKSTYCAPAIEDAEDISQKISIQGELANIGPEEHSALGIAEMDTPEQTHNAKRCDSPPLSCGSQNFSWTSHTPQQDALPEAAKCIEPVNQATTPHEKLSNEQRQELLAMHRVLLNKHHDFFTTGRHPTTSWELRKLVSKYTAPRRLLKRNLQPLLEALRQHAKDAPERVYTMFDITFGMLNRLMKEVPYVSSEWKDCNMIAKSLHHYVSALRQGGVIIPESQTELWSRRLCYGTINQDDIECSKRLRTFLCEPSTDSNSQTQLLTPPPSEGEMEEDLLHDLHFKFGDTFWAFVAGWYEIGTMIAKNTQDFYMVFVFLPWAASSMC
ncbi:hypothetical protein H2198_000851 [Neophaeococcomyces mojaviensis]|uniref:Uncharacterized protein n=1 Tax=Neophaeococcomyces mojaviensis TaxID=3383035 RepID=A0ACC3AIH5_9EURO|nr:hypothetical protein H2198_000851 [Knufia sp. JES_112]